jgi:hypothetical protein
MRQRGNALCRMPRVSAPQRKQGRLGLTRPAKRCLDLKLQGQALLAKIELNRFSFFATFPHGFEPLLARLAIG